MSKLEYLRRNSLNAPESVKGENTMDSLYEPELRSILSKDRTVKIGEWIIKVDLPNSAVLVLNQRNLDYYNDLLDNIPNEKILAFETTDNVLGILESGEFEGRTFKGLEGLFCNERRANAKTDEDYCGDDYLRYCQVRYYAAGVYFSLYAKIFDYQSVYAGQQRTDFTIDIGFEFDDRCDRSYDQLSWTTDSDSWSFPAAGSSYKLKAYESGYALKNYEIDGDFTVNIIDWYGNPGSEYESGTLSISDY